jgi:hypothetical protein
MIELKFVCDDPSGRRLAREYWLLDAHEEWIFSIRQLAEKHGIPSARMDSRVRKVCTARAAATRCSCCQTPFEVNSRLDFESLRRLNKHSEITCDSCQADARSKLELERLMQLNQEHHVIETWIKTRINVLPPKDYAAAPKEEAFLLYGLLASSGENWNNNELKAWSLYHPLLFAHKTDTISSYAQLHNAGWITPSTTSTPKAFQVKDGKFQLFHHDQVNWVLAGSPTISDYLELLPLLRQMLNKITVYELRNIWFRVCLSELRAEFEKTHDRFGFKSDGWTPLVQANMKTLLENCSLAEARGIIWSGFKGLVTAREDKNNPNYLVKNWIPGCFLRTYDRNKRYGPLKQWDRQRTTSESIYTGILFDQLLSEITNPYGILKGSSFADKPLNFPNFSSFGLQG